jgi:tetratricopeptide (TPR) repeat protein
LIGELLFEAARLEEALTYLAAVKEGEKEYFAANSCMATIYRDLGQVDRALEVYEVMRRVRPTDGIAHLSAGDVYLDKKRYEEAYEAYTKASTCEGTVAEGFQGLAEVAYEQKKLELAAEYYAKAVKARPDNPAYAVALREIQAEIEIRKQNQQLAAEPEAEETDTPAVGNAGDPQKESGERPS